MTASLSVFDMDFTTGFGWLLIKIAPPPPLLRFLIVNDKTCFLHCKPHTCPEKYWISKSTCVHLCGKKWAKICHGLMPLATQQWFVPGECQLIGHCVNCANMHINSPHGVRDGLKFALKNNQRGNCEVRRTITIDWCLTINPSFTFLFYMLFSVSQVNNIFYAIINPSS